MGRWTNGEVDTPSRCRCESDSRTSYYDFVAKLVKASDCNSEGVSSTLTEIFSCGKPDVKAYFLDAYETQVCKLNTYYRPIKLSVGNNYADYSDKVVMKIVSFSLEKDNF